MYPHQRRDGSVATRLLISRSRVRIPTGSPMIAIAYEAEARQSIASGKGSVSIDDPLQGRGTQCQVKCVRRIQQGQDSGVRALFTATSRFRSWLDPAAALGWAQPDRSMSCNNLNTCWPLWRSGGSATSPGPAPSSPLPNRRRATRAAAADFQWSGPRRPGPTPARPLSMLLVARSRASQP
jgi:hypothetical protein